MVKYTLPTCCSELFSYLLTASGLLASEARLAITDKKFVREKARKRDCSSENAQRCNTQRCNIPALFLYWIWVLQTILEIDKLVLKIR